MIYKNKYKALLFLINLIIVISNEYEILFVKKKYFKQTYFSVMRIVNKKIF